MISALATMDFYALALTILLGAALLVWIVTTVVKLARRWFE